MFKYSSKRSAPVFTLFYEYNPKDKTIRIKDKTIFFFISNNLEMQKY